MHVLTRVSLTLAAAALASLAEPRPCAAQVNVEKLRADLKQRPYFGNASVSFAGRVGNTNSIVFGANGFAGGLSGKHLFFVRAETDYETSEFKNTVAKSFAHARYNYELTSVVAGELFTQIQEDRFERLRLRTLYGIGPRFTLLESPLVDVHYGTGYMLEYERIDVAPGAPDEPTTWAHRFNNYIAFALAVDATARLTSATYFQPRFDRPKDYRILSELSLNVTLAKRLFTKLDAVLHYDSEPPTHVRHYDVEVQNSLGVQL